MKAHDYPFPTAEEAVPAMARLQQEAPLVEIKLPSGDKAWLVTRYAEALQVLKNPSFSRDLSVPGSPRMTAEGDFSDNAGAMVSLEGTEHARRRRPVARHMTARRVEALKADFARLVLELLNEVRASGSPAEFVHGFSYPVAARFMSGFLGVPDEDRDMFGEFGIAIAHPDQHTADEIATAFVEINARAEKIIALKRDKPADDLLTVLVAEQDNGVLTDWEVQVSVYELMLAGFLTTGSVLSSALMVLAEKDHLSRVRTDDDYLHAFVEECVRLYPPADSAFLRVAKQDTIIGGQQINAGDGVVVGLLSPNRDPRIYTAPDNFDCDRVTSRHEAPHLGFGHGAHHCLGAPLARMQLNVGLRLVAETFDTLEVTNADSLAWNHGLFERSLTELWMAWS